MTSAMRRGSNSITSAPVSSSVASTPSASRSTTAVPCLPRWASSAFANSITSVRLGIRRTASPKSNEKLAS